jgi:hypothetical protein
MIDKQRYLEDLRTAQEKLTDLLIQREEIEEEIAQLRRFIGGLSEILGQPPTPHGLLEGAPNLGLLASIVQVLKGHKDQYLTTAEVIESMIRTGLYERSNPNLVPSVQTALRRLVSNGSAEDETKDGKKAYRLKRSKYPAQRYAAAKKVRDTKK